MGQRARQISGRLCWVGECALDSAGRADGHQMREDITTRNHEDHVFKQREGETLLEGMRLEDVTDILQFSKSRQGCFCTSCE